MPNFAFDSLPTAPTPTAIGAIRYEIVDASGLPQGYEFRASVQVLDQANRTMHNANIGNVIQYLTNTEKQQLLAIFTRLRNEAAAHYLP